MGPFNNREIATAFWLLVLLAWLLRKFEIRKSLAGVVGAFFSFKILVAVCAMLLYASTVVALLAATGFWKFFLLKDSIVWFCVIAVSMMMRFATADYAKDIFQKLLVENIKLVIVLEFLVNTYTFSLPAELMFVPLLSLVVLVDAVASLHEEYSAVARLTKCAQIVVGFVILSIALSRAIADMHNLHNLDTLRSISLAPLLSLLNSPFFYGLALICKYELVFLRVDLGIAKERGLKRYARRRIIMHARLSLKRLHDLFTNHAVDLSHIQTESDVDRLLESNRDS